jgi:probable phosphomutase (TIGR03848 family)
VTTCLLVRHALCDPVGHALAGRRPGVHLNPAGRAQAAELARRLRPVGLDVVASSPLERARETAEAIAAGRELEVTTAEGLIEFDFGSWTGAAFSALHGDPVWDRFNRERSSTRAPGGERMDEVQRRAVAAVERLAAAHPGGRVAVVSHLDVLRAVLCHYLGVALDNFGRFELSPASVTVLHLDHGQARLTALNFTGEVPGS